MRRIREHLTYVNVISTLCLFLLLGGGTAAQVRFILEEGALASDV